MAGAPARLRFNHEIAAGSDPAGTEEARGFLNLPWLLKKLDKNRNPRHDSSWASRRSTSDPTNRWSGD